MKKEEGNKGGDVGKMNGKSLVNLQIAVEEVETMDELAGAGFYGDRSNAKSLTKGILLSINRFIDESAEFKIEKVAGKKKNGKVLVSMQIAAVEEVETAADALSERDIMGVKLMRSRISAAERSSAYY